MNYKKCLSVTIAITQLLAKNQSNYNETDYVIKTLQDWIEQARENNEYDTAKDWANGTKTNHVDEIVIKPLNCIEDYFS